MNRNRLRIFGAAASASLLAGCAASPAQSGDSTAATPVTQAAPVEVVALPEDAASERARTLLAKGGIKTDELRLIFRQPTEWSDSSLGCRRPGEMYTQALVQGETLRFSDSSRTYEVHVAGEHAVLCPQRVLGAGPKRPLRAANARNIDVMIEQARMDLAQRLGLPAAQVRFQQLLPASWADATLGCAEGSNAATGSVQGFRLVLAAHDAIYTYHTDLTRVIACPPLEAR